MSETKAPENNQQSLSVASHTGRYIVVGISLTLFNFVLYTIITRLFFHDNDFLWLSSLIATLITTILAYFLHSRVTWKDRKPTRSSVVRFFIWNAVLAIFISPGFTWLFGFLSSFHEFVFNISSSLGFSFDYDFVESTCIFGLTTIVTTIINYLFYDNFVFNRSEDDKQLQKIENKKSSP